MTEVVENKKINSKDMEKRNKELMKSVGVKESQES